MKIDDVLKSVIASAEADEQELKSKQDAVNIQKMRFNVNVWQIITFGYLIYSVANWWVNNKSENNSDIQTLKAQNKELMHIIIYNRRQDSTDLVNACIRIEDHFKLIEQGFKFNNNGSRVYRPAKGGVTARWVNGVLVFTDVKTKNGTIRNSF